MPEFLVSQVRVGRVRPLGPEAIPSGIHKDSVAGPVASAVCGLNGDEQGDRRNHGGPDKAIHAYTAAHYPAWRNDLPEIAAQFQPGAFGENLVVHGAVEADICLCDQWKLGEALFEVSQARQPCWRLNLRFQRPDMARRVQESGAPAGISAFSNRGTSRRGRRRGWSNARIRIGASIGSGPFFIGTETTARH